MQAQMVALRDASYARLAQVRSEAGRLGQIRDRRERRAALARIVALGKRTVDEAGGIADPYLLSQVRMQMAAALFDLAVLEPAPDRRSRLVAAGTRGCEAAVRTSLTSGAPFLSNKTVPWAMAVLAFGLRATADGESEPIKRLMASCARALPKIDALWRQELREAARTLFRAQLLMLASRQVTDAIDRGVVLRRALQIARDARRRAFLAGDAAVGEQAKTAIATIEGQLRSVAGAVARAELRARPEQPAVQTRPAQPRPAQPRPASRPKPPAPAPPARPQAPTQQVAAARPKFCGSCGTPTKEGAKFCGSCGAPL